MMHLAPPQRSPDFVKNSPLSTDLGWSSVDKNTMQHAKNKNIFGCGDIAQLPTAKTGVVIGKQAPIVVANILSLMVQSIITTQQYNGYSSCLLVTGCGKMVLAELDYDKNFTSDPKLKQMLVFDSSKDHWRLWMLKNMLAYIYWNKMMKRQNV
jgi:sulfide:quinone oxidoreductase